MKNLKVALVQTSTHWHDAAANRAMFDGLLNEAQGVDLVLLPEMFSTGFTMASAEVAEPMDGPTVTWLRERASRQRVAIGGSVVIEEQGERFNRFVLAGADGELLAVYDKRHRFRMAGEHEHYSAGVQRLVVELDGWRLCLLVCYDLRFPVWLRNRQDYDALVCVANWPAARAAAWRALLAARAAENLAYMVAVNVLGTDGNGVTYQGDSGVWGPDGVARLDCGETPGVYSAVLDGAELVAFRDAFPAWQDADEFTLDK